MSSPGGEPGGLSDHPTDRLIRELITSRRENTPGAYERIIERLATAPFDTREVPVRPVHRGISYGGITLGTRARSLNYHLVQRVVTDRQWATGTTEATYLADMERAVRFPAAHLAVYERRGGAVAVAITETAMVIEPARLGPGSLRYLLVVYSADRGMIVSAYQFSDFAVTSIPEDPLWLKR